MGNTEFHYMYRDQSNYKTGASVVFSGDPTKAQIDAITGAIDDGEYFIPSQVGLDDLQRSWSGELYDDDHVWHELISIQPTADAPTTAESFADFAARFDGISWDVEAAAVRIGLGEEEDAEEEPTAAPVPSPARSASLRDALGPRGR